MGNHSRSGARSVLWIIVALLLAAACLLTSFLVTRHFTNPHPSPTHTVYVTPHPHTSPPSPPPPVRHHTSPSYQVVTVQPGQSLWIIASQRFGNPLKWHQIWRLNRSKIKDPSLIYPGQVLRI